MPDPKTRALLEELKVDITARLASTQKLFDRLDTSAWPIRDREAFEALVEEKRQIEKQHHKNAMNDVAGRQRKLTTADFNADNDFRYDHDTAGYKFTGHVEKCAMDAHDRGGLQCHHEVCKQAKANGISYLEYDTIMHYKQRISAAKTPRMKDALRKQRDVQLLKDLQAREEWKEKAIKKLGNLGKEAGEAILGAASHFTGKAWVPPILKEDASPDNAIEQVGRALSEMRIDILPKYKHDLLETIAARITGVAGSHTYHWRNPAQFVNFFATVQISHLDAAVMNIREILELNAVLPYEVEYCLQGMITQYRELVVHVTRNKRNRLGYTLGESLHDVKEILKATPGTDKVGVLPKNDIYHALTDCITIEKHYSTEMMRCAGNTVRDQVEPEDRLKEIEMQGMIDSPLPTVSIRRFQSEIEQGQQHAAVHWFLDMAERKKATLSELREAAIQKIRHMANNDARRFMDIWEEISDVEDRLSQLDTEKPYAHQHGMIRTALDDVKVKLTSLIVAYDRLKEEETCLFNEGQIKKRVDLFFQKPNAMIQHLPGMKSSQKLRNSVLGEYAGHILESKAYDWASLLSKHIWRGTTELYQLCQFLAAESDVLPEDPRFALFTSEPEIHALEFAHCGYTVVSFLVDRHLEGWCLPAATTRLLVLLPYICSLNPWRAKFILRQLSDVVEGRVCTHGIQAEWLEPLRFIGTAVLQIYGYLVIECTHVLGRSDVEQVVFSLLLRLMFNALVAHTREDAIEQSRKATAFIAQILKTSDTDIKKAWFEKMLVLIGDIVEKHQIRCGTPQLCAQDRRKVATSDQNAAKEHVVQQTTPDLDQSSNKEHCGPLSTPPTSLLSTRKTIKASLFLAHDRVLPQIVNSPHFDLLAASRMLKYLAYRVKTDVNIQGSLQVLWLAFLRAEVVLGRTRSTSNFTAASRIPTMLKDEWISTTATSLCINMHNHCNIWELCESPEKANGFFEGYLRGFRDRRDMDVLLESLTLYAVQHGCDSKVQTKAKQLLSLVSNDMYPIQIAALFENVKSCLQMHIRDELELMARANVNKLDSIMGVFPEYESPSKQFIDDLLLWPTSFEKYCLTLVEVLRHLAALNDRTPVHSEKVPVTPEEIKTAGEVLLKAVDDDPDGSNLEDPTLAKIAVAADHVWHNSKHEDIIYSEPEEEEEEEDELETKPSTGFAEGAVEHDGSGHVSRNSPVLPSDSSSNLSDTESDATDESGLSADAVFDLQPDEAQVSYKDEFTSDDESDDSNGSAHSPNSIFDLAKYRGLWRHALLASAGLDEDDFFPESQSESELKSQPEKIDQSTQTIVEDISRPEGNLLLARDEDDGNMPPNTAELETLQNTTTKEQRKRRKRRRLLPRYDPLRKAAQWIEHPKWEVKIFLDVLIQSEQHELAQDIRRRLDAIREEKIRDGTWDWQLDEDLEEDLSLASGEDTEDDIADNEVTPLKQVVFSSQTNHPRGRRSSLDSIPMPSESTQKLRDRELTPYPADERASVKRRNESRKMVVELFNSDEPDCDEHTTETNEQATDSPSSQPGHDRSLTPRPGPHYIHTEELTGLPAVATSADSDAGQESRAICKQEAPESTIQSLATASHTSEALPTSSEVHGRLKALQHSLSEVKISLAPSSELHTFMKASSEGAQALEDMEGRLGMFEGMCKEMKQLMKS